MTKSDKQMMVSVAVATLWTSPGSPREIDRKALLNPVDLTGWLSLLSDTDRLDLYGNNRVQSQVLYGTMVYVLEEIGEWAKIAVPEQPSPKEPLGYPGWVPTCQLSDNETIRPTQEEIGTAVVTSKRCTLYSTKQDPGIELSFLTQLPVLELGERWVKVATPHGQQLLLRENVTMLDELVSRRAQTGRYLVETAKKFCGLRYLWGGMSSYGFDCSGFVYAMHRAHGILIPRDSSVQALQGTKIARDELLPGDLLFFAHEEGKGRVHHVGMYIGNNQMIHSPDSLNSIEIVSLKGYKLEKEHSISRRYW